MDIKQKYFNEIDNIKSLTMSLRRGEIHELHPEVKQYSYASNLADSIDERIEDLLDKIENLNFKNKLATGLK